MRVVEIAIRHSKFVPDAVTVRPGETVEFVLTNFDPIDHEFILGDEKVQQRHEKGTEPYHGDKPGEVSVLSGRRASTTFTFAEAGVLIFGCHAPGHYDYGMRGLVSIE